MGFNKIGPYNVSYVGCEYLSPNILNEIGAHSIYRYRIGLTLGLGLLKITAAGFNFFFFLPYIRTLAKPNRAII